MTTDLDDARDAALLVTMVALELVLGGDPHTAGMRHELVRARGELERALRAATEPARG